MEHSVSLIAHHDLPLAPSCGTSRLRKMVSLPIQHVLNPLTFEKALLSRQSIRAFVFLFSMKSQVDINQHLQYLCMHIMRYYYESPRRQEGQKMESHLIIRSISLTLCTCIFMELLVHRRLTWCFETYELILEQHSGFRRVRSARWKLWCRSLKMRRRGRTDHTLCFLHVSRAFDSLTHAVILQQQRLYSVQGKLYRFIDSFLKGQLGVVRGCGVTSSS